MRLTLSAQPEHHVTIPVHDALRIGTLAAILSAVATRLGISRDELAGRLFGRSIPPRRPPDIEAVSAGLTFRGMTELP